MSHRRIRMDFMASPKLCPLPRRLYHPELVRRLPKRAWHRDYTGAVVGGCEILGLAGFMHDRSTTWLYRCRCGKLGLVVTRSVISGQFGCGCKRIKHGQARSPLYNVWRRINGACYDPDHPSYHVYGARGATVCRRWRKSVSDFIEDVGRRPSGRHVLGLVDMKRGFRPGNVRWMLRAEQRRREGKHLVIEYRGERLSVSEWARRLGISQSGLWKRVMNCQTLGADVTEALTTPVGKAMPCVWGR